MKRMMKENRGHIVTIASVAGMLGTYNCTDYSATKFAAIGYHESLFTELKVINFKFIIFFNEFFCSIFFYPGTWISRHSHDSRLSLLYQHRNVPRGQAQVNKSDET